MSFLACLEWLLLPSALGCLTQSPCQGPPAKETVLRGNWKPSQDFIWDCTVSPWWPRAPWDAGCSEWGATTQGSGVQKGDSSQHPLPATSDLWLPPRNEHVASWRKET